MKISAPQKPKCPECAMDIPVGGKICPHCKCVFSDEERDAIRKAGMRKQNDERRRNVAKADREYLNGEDAGKTYGFWFTLLGGLTGGFFWLVLGIVYLVNAIVNTRRSQGFVVGMWIGIAKAIIWAIIAMIVVFVFLFALHKAGAI